MEQSVQIKCASAMACGVLFTPYLEYFAHFIPLLVCCMAMMLQ